MWRSRLLDIADVPGLRPTSERIRETLFNWLAPRLPGARCLDLFAGTGALGLEALSRGAATAVFVESAPRAAAALRRNIDTLGAAGAMLRETDAADYLEAGEEGPFDIVFLDPPFADVRLEPVCASLAAGSLLAPRALVYFEDERNRPEPALPPGWKLLKSKMAGNVRYSLAEAA
jgi:16S rRNA (guanine966-N2)-methyltransferase